MATYVMDDGTVVRTENAVESWNEARFWDGRNHVSKATGSQWTHERLYKTRKGRYWVERWSQWQGVRPTAEWLSERDAARWLLANDHELPDDLAHFEEELCE
jgi:hypothetical protein